jgi:hypothetical protein
MALAYDATRVTRDVDSLFMPHGIVLEEARNVAEDLGLPPWWLNEQASVYISGKDDPGKRRVFDHPGLRVTAASPHHIFAMKALAARTRDIDDLRILADLIGVDSAEMALRICEDFFPDESVPPRTVAVLQELFGLRASQISGPGIGAVFGRGSGREILGLGDEVAQCLLGGVGVGGERREEGGQIGAGDVAELVV